MENLSQLKREILTYGDKVIGESLWALEQSLHILDWYHKECQQIKFLNEHGGKEYEFMKQQYPRLKRDSYKKDSFDQFKDFSLKLVALKHYGEVEQAGTFYLKDQKYHLEELVNNITTYASSIEEENNPDKDDMFNELESFSLNCFKNFIDHIKPHLVDEYTKFEACLSYLTREINPFTVKTGSFSLSGLQLHLQFLKISNSN
ncbi:MAG: hypothetical protein ABIG52_00495 [Nanoarchaeota archaeon]